MVPGGSLYPDRPGPQRRPGRPRERSHAIRAGLVPHRDPDRGRPFAGKGPVIGGAAGGVAEHPPGFGQGAEPARRAVVGRPGVRVLIAGPAPPGLRDLLV